MNRTKKTSPKPQDHHHQRITVLKSALLSRLLLLTLILIWRSLLSPYDTSAPLNPNCLSNTTSPPPQEQRLLWPSLASAIESSIVWDSVYFVRIAQCGYEYEQSYAFLPLLPLCISFFSRTVFAPLVPVIGQRAVLGLSGYVINNIAFVFAAVYFYQYSESLYALFSIGGLYHLRSGRNNIAVLWFALSGFARSNGVINAGYICFQTMRRTYNAVLRKSTFLVVQVVVSGALHCICIFVPVFAFQAYGYYNICVGDSPEKLRPWCKARVPLLYNYIQSHYWGVGFLRYFQFKQLPNFLLASPVLSLALCSFVHYAKSVPEKFFSLGFRASIKDKNSAAVLFTPDVDLRSNLTQTRRKASSKIQDNNNTRPRKQIIREDVPTLPSENFESTETIGYLSVFVLPSILHLGFLAATAFFVMHVQVATRFLSSSPSLYWFASYLMRSPSSRRWGYMIWAYSAAYILLGSLLFSNFYPFT
ncbi:GPI mannosyltransferase 2 isoform X2 [Morus notabilis]|uniref:GPI mannosyltransferase 2 isoform X2 n=1 Tax=Morus notabilis TaxID=981085 RepID=UPI000CED358C|nr:GPI mannosyltransferase 2 isoform X2 [Morus notabilis]